MMDTKQHIEKTEALIDAPSCHLLRIRIVGQ